MRADRGRLIAGVVVVVALAAASVAANPIAAHSDDRLAAREMILSNQVGFARGTTHWRARELYRLLQNPSREDGQALPPIDRARAVVAGLNALKRDRQEQAALAKELAQARAERAAIVPAPEASKASAARESGPPPAFVSPVDGGIEAGFGPARDAAANVWLFRAGVRLRVRAGEAVRAPEAGVVQRIADNDGGARTLVIAHAGGWISVIGGLAVEAGASVGQTVTRGQTIGHAVARPREGIGWELSHHRAAVDPATVMRR